MLAAGLWLLAGSAVAQAPGPEVAIAPAANEPETTADAPVASTARKPYRARRYRTDHDDLVPDLPDWARAALDQAGLYQQALQGALTVSEIVPPPADREPESRVLDADDPDRDALLARIEVARRQLADAQLPLTDRPGAELRRMLELLLDTARARLNGELNPSMDDETVSKWIDSAGMRLEAAREFAERAGGPEQESILQQIKRAQEQLDAARRQSVDTTR
ncbi:MAG: hypothetical protein LJE84_09590 [Gammaproteobacteria bacterium]|nr:hypothetical protein [Gammaproteobacteria bacterium]